MYGPLLQHNALARYTVLQIDVVSMRTVTVWMEKLFLKKIEVTRFIERLFPLTTLKAYQK